jgi:3-mercaptopyruvate sulfurtransferase SseA
VGACGESRGRHVQGRHRPAGHLREGDRPQAEDDVIAYCRIGERSSHTWFVLKYLLGVNNVKNYDGSWTEWGNLVGAPIEVGEGAAMANVKCQ